MRESEIRKRLADYDVVTPAIIGDGPIVCLYLVAAFDVPPTDDGKIPAITVTRTPPKAHK